MFENERKESVSSKQDNGLWLPCRVFREHFPSLGRDSARDSREGTWALNLGSYADQRYFGGNGKSWKKGLNLESRGIGWRLCLEQSWAFFPLLCKQDNRVHFIEYPEPGSIQRRPGAEESGVRALDVG